MSEHPSAHELAATFLTAGHCGRTERAKVVRHILAGCESCLDKLRALDPRGQLPRPLRRLRSSGPSISSSLLSARGPDYDRAFVAVERTLSFFLSEGRPVVSPPAALLAELGMPAESRHAAASLRADRLAIAFLARWLIEKSHSLRYSDPEEMLNWALMARLAAHGCSREAAGSPSKLADLRAEAEAQLSNALRVLGRVGEAQECMKTAWRELERGTGDPELRATVLAKTTSLLTLQKDFQLAMSLALQGSMIYTELGLRHRSAATQVTGAIAMLYDGDPERASRALLRALPEVDPEEDPTLLLLTRNNLVRCYLDLGEPAKAIAIHRGLQGIRPDIEPLILLRMDWQEGLLLNALSDRTAAVRMLTDVRNGYIERRLAREAIVVTRDLARTLVELEEGEIASRLLEEMAGWLVQMRFGSEMLRFFDELRGVSS